jgi:hypothetical protein
MLQVIKIIVIAMTLTACDSEVAINCFQTAGNIVQEEFTVSPFERILVNRDIELIIKEAPSIKVTVETGENLLNDIDLEVIGDRLVLTDNNTCNLVRGYGITKIYIEAPNLTEVRSSTQFTVRSDGPLNYNTLTLISEDFIEETDFSVGDFRVRVNSENLNILSNGISLFFVDGNVENLDIGFFSGASRFEGADLIAQHISMFHRASNDMIVNPQQSISGELKGTGDVIALNEPPIVDVQQFYTGQLIFN